jgi:hypothetical protein
MNKKQRKDSTEIKLVPLRAEHHTIPVEPTSCGNCHKLSTECPRCPINPEIEAAIQARATFAASIHFVVLHQESQEQGSRYDVFMGMPMARGARSRAENRIAGRIAF